MSATFAWRGRQDGRAVSGVFEAANAAAVSRALRQDGITPVEIRPSSKRANDGAGAGVGAGAGAGEGSLKLPWGAKPGMNARQRAFFEQQLYTQLSAGVPLSEALTTLGETTHEGSRRVIASLLEQIRAGGDLSTAMASHPEAFDRFTVAMVRVGESSGALETVFARLVDHEEFQIAMRRQVSAALRYPAFVIFAMAVAIGVINVMVIPTFKTIFDNYGAQLPMLTRALLLFSDLTVRFWWVVVLGAGAAAFAAKRQLATRAGRLVWGRLVLRIPLVGKVVRMATLARFARSLSITLGAGVPIEQALGLVGSTLGNDHVSEKIALMRAAVARGEGITASARATGEFTTLVLQMFSVGEQTGTIDKMMDRLASYFDTEVQTSLRALTQAIEPILVIAIGALVLVVALGVFLPMWNLNSMALQH